jgi:beta-galactosidase beta subunit
MILTDRNTSTADFNNISSNNIFLNYQINLLEKNLSLSFNLNSTKLNMATGLNGNEGITAGIQKRAKDQKWMIGYNTAFLQSTTNNLKSIILNNGIRIELQPANMHRFNILLNHIGNFPENTDAGQFNTRFNEWRGEIGYNFNF